MPRLYNAIGLMSGTSLDGIDVAMIETDGGDYVAPVAAYCEPYQDGLRQQIRGLLGATESTPESSKVEEALTKAQAHAVREFMRIEGISPSEVDVIGFHGQTINHLPDRHWTWQLGDGSLLAKETGIDVVNRLRHDDMEAGGQGAPLLPVYHRARMKAQGFSDPVAVFNIGGVSNVTWIGRSEEEILAFDTGPGNALIDDVMLSRTGNKYDESGKVARRGHVDAQLLERFMTDPFFEVLPPKSLDRDAWDVSGIEALSTEDAVATLTAFTVQANLKAAEFFPEPVQSVFVTGGGRHNATIMGHMQRGYGVPVRPVDDLGWNGDVLEAEGWAYFAVRSLLGKPITLPTTTGVDRPLTGGTLHKKP
jgi:anhydro-N-acetylmuramic acid kinase